MGAKDGNNLGFELDNVEHMSRRHSDTDALGQRFQHSLPNPMKTDDTSDLNEKAPFVFRTSPTGLSYHSADYGVFSPQIRHLRRQFHPTKQLWKVLFSGFCRWVVTLGLVIGLYGILIHYSNKVVMTEREKKIFNALITGLSIALGLNIMRSLKALALEMRWWILSRKSRSLLEVDLILKCESLTHVAKLAVVAPRPKVLIAVFAWIILNIASQVGLATLGLIYNTDTADDFALLKPGTVAIPDMSQIVTAKAVSSASQAQLALQYTANLFGSASLAFNEATLDDMPVPGELWGDSDPQLFDGDSVCTYLFTESNPVPDNSTANPVYVYTNRSITASGICEMSPVVIGGDGSSTNITVLSEGKNITKSLPIALGTAQTTYVVDPESSCGSGCSPIEVFESAFNASWYYSCNVTVGNVTNTTLPQQEVAPSLLTLAAKAIALQGYGASSLVNDTRRRQYQSYPAETNFGVPTNGNDTAMAFQLARFAMGVVSATAINNPSLFVPGNQPQLGIVLSISGWKYVHIILGLTAGIQLLLFIIVAFLVNTVVVKDDSHLAVARLLRPMVDRMGDAGTTADARDICSIIAKDEKFIYSVKRKEGESVWQVDIGQEKKVRAFPIGTYD